MANTTTLAIGAIVVIVVIVAVVALSSGGKHTTTTILQTASSTVSSGSGSNSSTVNATTTSSGGQQSGASGSVGNITYDSLSASGYSTSSGTFNLTLPWSGSSTGAFGGASCAIAGSNSSSTFSMDDPAQYSNGKVYCLGGENSTPMSLVLDTVTGYAGFNDSVTQPFSAPYVMNYSINNSYSTWLVAIPVACGGGTCSVSLPSGCQFVQNASYLNTSASLAICKDPSPGRYQVTITPHGTGSVSIGSTVYLYYK